MIDALDLERLQKTLEGFQLEARLLRAWRLLGGISASMTAFEIKRGDGATERLIARRPNHGHSAAEEFRVLVALQDAGLPVPPPRHLAPDGTCLVVGYIEGELDLSPLDPTAYLRRYAEALARVHRVDPTGLGLPVQSRHHSKRPTVLNASLREGEIRDAIAAALPSVALGHPVLRHGDFWPGNVLWRDGEIAGIIDWEAACVGEPLADLAICRLDLLWILGPEAMDVLTRHYEGLTDLDLADLPYWDLCASLRPVANIEEWAPSYRALGRPDVTEATMRRHHALFVERALEKIRKDS